MKWNLNSLHCRFTVRIYYSQRVVFNLLSYCFEGTTGFDVKASFASRPVSRLIRWYNKKIMIKIYSVSRDFTWIEITNCSLNCRYFRRVVSQHFVSWNKLLLIEKHIKLSRWTLLCLKFFVIRNRKIFKGGPFLLLKLFGELSPPELRSCIKSVRKIPFLKYDTINNGQ